ncbi:MAG: stearoyl-CoA desaturase [Myxococcaceae bacterium]
MTDADDPTLDRPAKVASVPFLAFHLLCGLAFFTGFSWKLGLIALGSYYLRMFGVTAGYHRYFSHRAFKTNRVFQFLLAWLAQLSAQKGVLWWAAHHRHHHRYSDAPEDIHSPARKGFWWSHVGWILARRYDETDLDAIKDFARYPELRWLDKYHLVPALSGLALSWIFGGLELFVWAGVIPTVLLWHGTFTINSLSHIFGTRRYLTTDTSRNNWLLALVTLGEGWHNNHHYHQNTANQGWFWWEVDLTFYMLKVLSWLGVVSGLRLPTESTRYAFRAYTAAQRAQLNAESRFGMYLPRPAARTPGETVVPGVMAPAPAALLKR